MELDRDELKKLLEPAAASTSAPEPVLADGSAPMAPELGRTATVHDPLTMALLAEVARDSRTVEMDPATIARAMAAADADAPSSDDTDTAHPHLKRRG